MYQDDLHLSWWPCDQVRGTCEAHILAPDLQARQVSPFVRTPPMQTPSFGWRFVSASPAAGMYVCTCVGTSEILLHVSEVGQDPSRGPAQRTGVSGVRKPKGRV